VVAAQKIEEGLAEFAPDAEITFERLAVSEQQIVDWNLPTRPTKTSTHSKGFEGASVELDAIEPATLRALVREAIERHLDADILENTRGIEELERLTMESMVTSWVDSMPGPFE
jgi:hypothetical protein